MSCSVMYQPYAMLYSSCDRSSDKQKMFKFPHAPSPPDSSHSEGSAYNSPGPLPSASGSSPVATVTSHNQQQHQVISHHSSQPQPSQSSSANSRRSLTPSIGLNIVPPPLNSGSSGGSGGSSSSAIVSSRSSSSSHSHDVNNYHGVISAAASHHSHNRASSSSAAAGSSTSGSSSSSSSSHRAHYVSANCVIVAHYDGDVSRVIDEHFERALNSTTPYTDKGTKYLPMLSRNFPESFFNSNYQPVKPLTTYGADFYGMDYGVPALAHHHQPDRWHPYALSSHQSYYHHHRPTEIPYPPMPSSSRFNATPQYGSFFLGAGSSSGRFPGLSDCGMKGDTAAGAWTGRYHESDLYSAAAAAHYSNMTAGFETTVQDSSKEIYWI